MLKTNESGSAFGVHHPDITAGYHGMSLRDYFAAATFPVFIGVINDIELSTRIMQAAKLAYLCSDALIKARDTD